MKERKKGNWVNGLVTLIVVAFILMLVHKVFQWLDETPQTDADDLEI